MPRKLDLPRVHDCWCWPKGPWPLRRGIQDCASANMSDSWFLGFCCEHFVHYKINNLFNYFLFKCPYIFVNHQLYCVCVRLSNNDLLVKIDKLYNADIKYVTYVLNENVLWGEFKTIRCQKDLVNDCWGHFPVVVFYCNRHVLGFV